MRPVLLGSAAMAALGLVAADAAAADGVQLSIGGRYKGAAGVLPTEDFSPSSGTEIASFLSCPLRVSNN